MGFPEICMQRATRKRSPPGSWTWTRCFRSSTCVLSLQLRPLLTSCFQKTLTINTDPAVPGVTHDATNTHTVVSGVQNNVVNPAVVSDSHCNALKSSEDTCGQNRVVYTIHTTSGSSAPGDSPPPLPSTRGTVSDIRQDIRTFISEVRRDITTTQNMVSDIQRTTAKGQEGSGGTNLSVSETHTLSIVKCPLTVA